MKEEKAKRATGRTTAKKTNRMGFTTPAIITWNMDGREQSALGVTGKEQPGVPAHSAAAHWKEQGAAQQTQ